MLIDEHLIVFVYFFLLVIEMDTYVWKIYIPGTYGDHMYVIAQANNLVEAREKVAKFIKEELSEEFWDSNKCDIEERSPYKKICDDVFSLDDDFS